MTYSTLSIRLMFSFWVLLTLQACTTYVDTECSNVIDCENSNTTSSASNPSASGKKTQLGISTFEPELVIATDLINALVQIPKFSEQQAVLKLPDSNSTFMRALEKVLLERGFRVVRSPNRTGNGVLMASSTPHPTNASYFNYILAIDRIAMKRTYYIKDRFVSPVSSLYVRGISPLSLELNDGLFIERQ